MKILHVFDHSIPLHSGYTFRSRAILEHQHRLGWETVQVTGPKHNLFAHPDSDEEDIGGLHFYRTRPITGTLATLPIVNQIAVISALEKRLQEMVPKIKPDIIHAHSPALNGRAAINVGKRYGVPVVYEVRAFWEDAAVDHGTHKQSGIRYRLTRALETWVVRHANKVTTICEGLRDELVTRGIPKDKISVIPNAVDINQFKHSDKHDESLAREIGLADKVVLGFIGSFYAYEGLTLLLRALPAILEQIPNVNLLLVGGGPDEANLRELCTKLGLEEQVVFIGRVPHENIHRYYNLVDIFIYPRLSMRLTDLVTPLKPLEAMAQGRLVVASDVGGHRELIRPGETGELFRAGDPVSLTRVVVTLLADKQRWVERKTAARRFVESERNWQVSVAAYQPIYEELAVGRGKT